MRIYSDCLSRGDFLDCLPAGCSVEIQTIQRPKVRKYGWIVTLRHPGRLVHVNTGTAGAGEEGAASWDEWGYLLAELYWRDGEMRAGEYQNFEDFHGKTRDKYRGF